MKLPTHLAVNTAISIPMQYYFNWNHNLVMIFILTGALIDIDHLLFFLFKYEEKNIRFWISKAKELRNEMEANLYIFHSPEFNLLLFLLSFKSQLFFVIFLSNLIHIFLDTIDHYLYHRNFLWIKKWYIISPIIKNRRRKKLLLQQES